MRVLKWLAGVIVGLALLFVVVGFFLPGSFTVVRSLAIAAPPEKVYALVADPRGWKQWSAWNKRDPQMQIEYGGPPAGMGAKWSWKSKSQGDGEMTFTAAEPGKRVALISTSRTSAPPRKASCASSPPARVPASSGP